MIKFRAWHKEKKRMLHIISLGWNPADKYSLIYACFLPEDARYYYPHEVELMQYTGLLDAKMKQIYCDDIVRLGNKDCFYVKYLKGAYLLCWDEIDVVRLVHRDKFLGDYLPSEIEVIGNLWENPELLEQK